MEIADSARKHSLTDEAILHAARNPIAVIAVKIDRIFFIGTTDTGAFLEIVVLDPGTDEATVIHADICRPKFYRYL